jgi:RNA polymerase sigma-70 factor (ECF subfamily)
MPPTDLITGQSFPTVDYAALSAKPSEIEREVLSLFDQFRDPLLRYALSLGIQVHDAEEIVQETFLALFRHLQLGRSKKNLSSRT